jgi:hypothetical protein
VRSVAAALLAALLLAPAGCGSDDEPAGGGEPDREQAPREGEGTGKDGSGRPDKPANEGAPPGGLGPAADIRVVIDSVLAGGEPLLACDLYVTSRYLGTAYGGRDGCVRAQGKAAVADAVEIRSVKVRGATATAMAVPSGGASDGEKLDVELVHEGGAWKVDAISSDVPVGP